MSGHPQKHQKIPPNFQDFPSTKKKHHDACLVLLQDESWYQLIFLYDVQVDAYVYTASYGDNCACDGAFRKAPELLSLYLLVKILDLFHRGEFVVVCFKRMVDFAMKPI